MSLCLSTVCPQRAGVMYTGVYSSTVFVTPFASGPYAMYVGAVIQPMSAHACDAVVRMTVKEAQKARGV